MFKQKFIIGGELVFSPSIVVNRDYHQFSDYGSDLQDYKRYHTFGAYYSLQAVIGQLNFQPGEYALLPSYLCPTIIEPFRSAKAKYVFYKMKEGLLPDLGDIDKKAKSGLKAVLFIDYFGFPQKDYLQEIVGFLRTKGVRVIQDTVQSWLNNEPELYGDFCLNSVRKYSPFEGSALLSKTPMSFKTDSGKLRKFLQHKRYGQILRYCHIKYGLFHPASFLSQFETSNLYYHGDGMAELPKLNRWLLDRLDFEALGRNRKYMYKEMLNKLKPRLILGNLGEDAVPFGMAIYLEDRDQKKVRLHERGVHCPVHWLLPEEIDIHEHDYSWELQHHALTLPVSLEPFQLKTYIEKLQEVL